MFAKSVTYNSKNYAGTLGSSLTSTTVSILQITTELVNAPTKQSFRIDIFIS